MIIKNYLGLLGLLGILALILIYILKPNFQQKVVSSTHVWKLSLKYRRKRLPINRFRNILILICQILIISGCAFILMKPNLMGKANEEKLEKIAIIDASASMLALQNGVTRYERAVSQVKEMGQDIIERQGYVTVILAAKDAKYIVSRAETLESFDVAMQNQLIGPGKAACSYGEADIAGAMALAELILFENPTAEVIFYTAKQYFDDGGVTIENVAKNEWNAAILGCTVEIENNAYIFTVQAASYGADCRMLIYLDFVGADARDVSQLEGYNITVTCQNNEPVEYIIDDLDIWAFEYIRFYLYLQENDSFSYDNEFILYGGTKDKIKVQYSSSVPNPFIEGSFSGLRTILSSRWDIDTTLTKPNQAEMEGFDFYVFEGEDLPETLPMDGVVMVIPPDKSFTELNKRPPENLGLEFGESTPASSKDTRLSAGTPHKIMNGISPGKISVDKYLKIDRYDGFEALMFCDSSPAVLIKDEIDSRMIVLSFSLNYSNLPVLLEFPVLMLNIFNHFIPPTITEYLYEVNQTVTIRARGTALTVSGQGITENYYSYSQDFLTSIPGSYNIVQTLISSREVSTSFYVKIPQAESDFSTKRDKLVSPEFPPALEPKDLDLLIYLAAALLALLFIEWWLHSREQT